ncbi:MAG: hypothetical protein CVT78_06480 [Alphaproteobacteria bacterium HGW-Alphaproteobacteria-17]|nr:MAG: hypothetical protein CVT78_06480 [Alphaproteobacteria bacterium HGW-Alphaproteobacteria-17]
MMRWAWPITLLLLAACSKGEPVPDDAAKSSATPDLAEPALSQEVTADYHPDPALPPPTTRETGIGARDKVIPAAIRGRWGLAAADCTSTKGDAKGLLTIDATSLRFYESHGELARIRERGASRIVADYKFSGEGMEWDRLMLLDAQGGGQTLVRRDYGDEADTPLLRYTRCS